MYHTSKQSRENENTTAVAPSRPNIFHDVAANQFWPESAHRQMSDLMDADLQHQTNLQLARVDAAGARMNAAISQL